MSKTGFHNKLKKNLINELIQIKENIKKIKRN